MASLELLEFIERKKAQLWFNKQTQLWTCQVILPGLVTSI